MLAYLYKDSENGEETIVNGKKGGETGMGVGTLPEAEKPKQTVVESTEESTEEKKP